MTRKKFVTAILEAICSFTSFKNESDNAKKMCGMKAGMFYGIDENGNNESEHYILLELADGTKWRLIPERALVLEPHEEKLWKEMKENGDFEEDE